MGPRSRTVAAEAAREGVSTVAGRLEIAAGAPQGTYRPPARDLVFETPSRRGALRIRDDGHAHRIVIR